MIDRFRRLVCQVAGHRFVVAQEFPGDTRRIGCTRCRRSWAMSDELRVMLPWSKGFHDLYTRLGNQVVYQEWERYDSYSRILKPTGAESERDTLP